MNPDGPSFVALEWSPTTGTQFPDTAIHAAPLTVDAVPTWSRTGTYPPGFTPAGIWTTTCMSPATSVGAPPAYVKVAGMPPTVTCTAWTGCGYGGCAES